MRKVKFGSQHKKCLHQNIPSKEKKPHKIKSGSRLGKHFFPHKAILLQEKIRAIPSVVVRARVMAEAKMEPRSRCWGQGKQVPGAEEEEWCV